MRRFRTGAMSMSTGGKGAGGRRRWLRGTRPLAVVAALLAALPLVAAAQPASAAGCATGALVPVLRDVTANQGLGSYARLTRGKETLFRAYLSLPQCAAGTSATIQLIGAKL